MATIKVWDKDNLLSPEEKEDIIETSENLTFEWCEECEIINVYVSRYHIAGGENKTAIPRLSVLAEANDNSGYFGWHIY